MRIATAFILILAGWPAALALGQEAASQPATREGPSQQERLNDLLALVEGQTTPDVRLAIARELLLQGWGETPARLATLLGGSNGPAKIAVATALAELPTSLDPAYIDPLLAMLEDPDPGVRQSAGAALAAYPDNGVTARLRELVLDGARARPARLAGLAALGLMTEREAIEVLVTALDDPDAALALAALAALGQATAMDFGDDAAAARAWWAQSSTLPREVWQQRQIERLVRKDREMRRRLEAVEARLAKVLETSFLRAPDAERVSSLTAYLADGATAIRLLGLHLTRLHLAEGKSLPMELQDRVRSLASGSEAREQAAAVQTIASFREPADADRFLTMLSTVRSREVRLALLNGLGYVGTAAADDALLATLNDADEACATEAVAALGRLAERGVLMGPARDAVVTALLDVFGRTQPAQVALRERVLWAMGNIADPRSGLAFAAALDRQEAVVVRQAAVRGIAALRSPQWADVLATATSDPDAGVRKTAVETLALVGQSGSDRQLQALWDRAVSPHETDEALRQAAWRGLLEILAGGPLEDAERWLDRLPANGAQTGGRVTDLLERLILASQDSEPVDRARLGLLRARLAAQYARTNQPSDAVATYVAALSDLETARSDAVARVATELLRTALAKECYDEAVAAALANTGTQPGGDAMWQAALSEIEAHLTPEGAERALIMIALLERYPPAVASAASHEELRRLRGQALQLRPHPVETAPATRPASAPAAPPPS